MHRMFERRVGIAALVLFATSLASGAAHADQDAAAYASKQQCFMRRYDRKHLAAHPRQTVEAMSLGRSGAAGADPLAKRNNVVLEFAFRIDGETFQGLAYCRRDRCLLEGDGGSFTVHRVRRGLQLSVGEHLSLEGANGFSADLARSADDRAFLLWPAPAAACSAVSP